MAKAAASFKYKIDASGRYHQDAPSVLIKEGDEIPAGILTRLAEYNKEKIAGPMRVEYFSEQEMAKELVKEPKEEYLPKKKYSKEDLFKMTKAEQVDILRSFGLSTADINKLKTENERVNKILELQ